MIPNSKLLIQKSQEIDDFLYFNGSKALKDEINILNRLKDDLWNNYSMREEYRFYGKESLKGIDNTAIIAVKKTSSAIKQILNNIDNRERAELIADFLIKNNIHNYENAVVLKDLSPKQEGNFVILKFTSGDRMIAFDYFPKDTPLQYTRYVINELNKAIYFQEKKEGDYISLYTLTYIK